VIEQPDTVDRADGGGHGRDDLRAAALAHIRNAFD
jgi:hypothetical protein